MPLIQGCLWIVATPLGNLDDISKRALLVLSQANLVLTEDTRRAKYLFKKLDLHINNVESFFEHNESQKQPEIISRLQQGEQIALISDAGTPLLADPGYKLVKKCRELNIPVIPVPGPSAPITALCAAGMPPVPFTFLGFLPRQPAEIRQLFKKFADIPGSLIFFERKNRLNQSLRIAFESFGSRSFAICRELTKVHEEFIFGSLQEHETTSPNLLGELTVIIGPPEKSQRSGEEEILQLARDPTLLNLKSKERAKAIAPLVKGWTSGQIYQLIYKN